MIGPTSTRTVEVHKADIPLLDGETIQMYERKLRADLQKRFGKKPTKKSEASVYVWPRAVFADRVVIDKDELGIGDSSERLFSVAYTRKDDGAFDFGELVAVREQVSFVPMAKSEGGEGGAADEVETVKVDGLWDNLPL